MRNIIFICLLNLLFINNAFSQTLELSDIIKEARTAAKMTELEQTKNETIKPVNSNSLTNLEKSTSSNTQTENSVSSQNLDNQSENSFKIQN